MQNRPATEVHAVNICKESQRISFDILPLQLHGLEDNTCPSPMTADHALAVHEVPLQPSQSDH